MRSHEPGRRGGAVRRETFLVPMLLLAACDRDAPAVTQDQRVANEAAQLARFPGVVIFADLETPGADGARDLHAHLALLAPTIGRGVCVPRAQARPEGSRDAPRWGVWTYEYVRAPQQKDASGRMTLHFADVAAMSLGLEARGEYANGAPAGAWTFWHPNGALRAKGSFADGRLAGAWQFWNADGTPDPERSGVYTAGERTGALPR